MKNGILTLLVLVLVAHPLEAQSRVTEQLELAERDFQRATLEKGVEGWNSFFADSGAQLQNTSHIVRGHAAIKDLMGEFLASKTDRLIWWPVSSEVSASGDMAYTFGASGDVSADSTGKLGISGRGTYLTVWRRDGKGHWKVTADMGGQASARALERATDTIAVKEVGKMELARSAAIQARDGAALEKIYSYDFLGILPDGTIIGRAEFLPWIQNAVRFMSFRSNVQTVSVAGESAIVTGLLTTYSDVIGAPPTVSSFLNVYVRRDGKWQFIRGITNPLKK